MTPDTAAVDWLRTRFRGALVRPGDDGYDHTRRVWNGDIDRKPALIARCAGADDVAEVVRFAREHDLLVSVRGGGHAVAGHAVCDDGVMIDLSLMRWVEVDPATRTARVAGGALWSDVDRATFPHALATTGGIISHTGVGGLTLGGGLGHLMRKHGLTVDNVRGVELVTVQGDRIRVDEAIEPDLFWGLRGGGGNFGIATSFEYQLHQVGPLVLAGPIVWSLDDAPEVLAFLDEFAPSAPDELGLTISMMPAPPLPFLPLERFNTPVLLVLPVWAGELAAGEEAVAPLKGVASPIAAAVRPAPYVAVQSMLDGGAPHGRAYYWKAHRFDRLSTAFIDTVMSVLDDRPTTAFWQINGWAVGGAVSRVPEATTAVGHRAPGFELSLTTAWPPTDPHGEDHKNWVREGWKRLEPYSTGVYANFVSDEGSTGVAAAYGDRLARLTALKDRWDPTNFLRMNANIPPSETGAR